MSLSIRLARPATWLAVLLMTACGGHGDKPADTPVSRELPTPAPVAGPDSFLLWPNALRTPDGMPPPIDSAAYATAYYQAIDPAGQRATLDDWKRANGFDQAGGIQVSAVFGDFRDLGYGRRMAARCKQDVLVATRCAKDGPIAFLVENYLVNPGAEGYGARINLDAAVVEDRQWIASINAIEFSPGPGGSVRFAKFYSFDPATGKRRLTQDLDGRGQKALPGVCISCHGGRADALAPGDQMPLLNRSEAAQRGDVRGRLHAFDLGVEGLAFSDAPGFSRAAQQAALKTMNQMVICTLPRAVGSAAPEDACRDDRQPSEWQGLEAERVIKTAYGPAMGRADFGVPGVPPGWDGSAADRALYQAVVGPACIVCHQALGTAQQSEIDFTTASGFASYADRTRHHVFERGSMPLSRVLFERFWSAEPADGGMARKLADYLDGRGLPVRRDSNGQPVRPGGPVAIAGPDRRVAAGVATQLSAANSLFADRFRWTLKSGPAGATLADADTATATFTPASPSPPNMPYTVELVASRGSADSAPATLVLRVDTPTGSFADVKTVVGSCAGSTCHSRIIDPLDPLSGGSLLAFNVSQPLTDAELRATLRSRLNFGDLGSSLLLRKPAGEHHRGGAPLPDTSVLVDWALAGAPGP